MTKFRPGDVVTYHPDQRHCREGTAIAEAPNGFDVVLFDTFWGCGGDQHRLTATEVAAAEFKFAIGDYDELDRYSHSSAGTWLKYAPADRQLITSQHGLQKRWFIRKGATEDLATQIDNAHEKVAEWERAVESATRSLGWARDDLNRLLAAEGDQ